MKPNVKTALIVGGLLAGGYFIYRGARQTADEATDVVPGWVWGAGIIAVVLVGPYAVKRLS